MPNSFKSGTTATNGCIYDGNFIIGVDPAFAYGPTSTTSFYNGITPPTGGYTIYQNKAANGPSIRTAADDATMVSILQSMGSTGTTAAGALIWARQQTDIMVANIDYYGIVTSGLTFAVDASYVSSYPLASNIWYDLTKNGNNFVQYNLARFTYSSTSGGTINLNNPSPGTTATTTNISATTYTYCAFVNLTSFFSIGAQVIGTTNTVSGLGSGGPSIWTNSTNNSVGFNSVSFTGATTGTWVYYVGIQNATTQYLYANNVLKASATTTLTTGSTQTLQIGFAGDNQQIMNMGSFQIYNRALSTTEITQNYNALKTRFGL
jgi:VCBS repeat-containing protein